MTAKMKSIPDVEPTDDFRDILRKAFNSARSRSLRSRWDFELTVEDLTRMLDRQEGRCAVTGIGFNRQYFDDCLVKMPFSPSIDRIDSHRGYVRRNVRLVCVAANFGLGQWGDEVFRTLAVSTIENRKPLAGQPAASLDQRIDAANALIPLLTPTAARAQKRRIAALKRARTLGSDGLRTSAKRAHATKQHRSAERRTRKRAL